MGGIGGKKPEFVIDKQGVCGRFAAGRSTACAHIHKVQRFCCLLTLSPLRLPMFARFIITMCFVSVSEFAAVVECSHLL